MRALLAEHPELRSTVIAQRVGWTGSISWFRDNVRVLREDYLRPDPADRLEHLPGDVVQCDLWFPPVKVPIGAGAAPGTASSEVFPVLVMVSAHSRFIHAVMLPSRTTADLLAGMWLLLSRFGAVPRRLLWDNEAGIGRRGRLADGVAAFCGTLATRLVQCRPYDPESKGVVERANQYLETSFLPGRVFSGPADFNTQLSAWLDEVANRRVVRALQARPMDLLQADLAAMRALPPLPPVMGWSWQTRLGRDYYVRLDANDYSVDPTVIGRLVDVSADLDMVRVYHAGRLVAEHARCWARARTVTDPAHQGLARRLRQQLLEP